MSTYKLAFCTMLRLFFNILEYTDADQALHDAVDDASRMAKSTAAGGDELSHGGEQNPKARAFKSYGQKENNLKQRSEAKVGHICSCQPFVGQLKTDGF